MSNNEVNTAQAVDNKIHLTKKDLNKAYWTFEVFAQACCSYERLQAPGFFSGMKNIIAKLYPKKEDRIEACKRHMEFYNSEFALVGPVILGITIAMEEQKANGADIQGEAISGIKTSLMGPLAGIGDTLRQGTLIPIIGSIAISIGTSGNLLAPVLYMVATLGINWGIGYNLFHKAYEKGSELVGEFFQSGRMEKIMTMITTLGAIVIGALAATTVKLSTVLELNLGESPLNLQTDIFDTIALNILPFGACMLVYYLLRKKISVNKIIIFIFIFAIVFGLLGII